MWRVAFVAALMGAGCVLLGYTEARRLLHAALDDRYGQWVRFWSRSRQLPQLSSRFAYRFHYAVAFFFTFGAHDLMRFGTLLVFDLFVMFALLAPFWRYVFFEDWNPALAAALSMAGLSLYAGWKFRWGLQLCRLHGWSPETWQCARCGEYHSQAEERVRQRKAGKAAARVVAAPPAPVGWRRRLSLQSFWERRLEKLMRQLESEPAVVTG